MKSSTPIFKILSVAVLVAVVLYFSVQLHNYISDPLTTTLVYAATAEDTISVNGYLVRDEETFDFESGTLSHEQTEGAKVGIGQTIAVVYSNDSALDTAAKIEELELQLQQLQFALESYLDPDAALRLDSAINEDLLTIRRKISGGDYSELSDEISELKAGVMKRDYTYTTKEEIETDIAETQNQLEEYRRTLTNEKSISAPASGTYSGVCDGYETTLTPKMLSEMTVKQVESAKPKESTGNVGKMIYGDRWYYVAVISEEDAVLLEKRSQVMLRFAKGLGMDISMTIDRIGASENGKCVLVTHCDKYLAQTTTLRHQAAELILRDYEGIRVPANALRVNESGVSGVYCVVGVTARFKPVEVVYAGDGYVLVKETSTTEGSAVLRIGDEVIVTNGDVYDGKVVG